MPSVLRDDRLSQLPAVSLVAPLPTLVAEPAPETVETEGPSVEEIQAQAYEQGLAAGRAEAAQMREHALSGALSALDRAVADMEQARTAWQATRPAESIELGLEIAEMIMIRELEVCSDPGREAILRCMDQLELSETVVIRMNPEDFRQLGVTEEFLAGRSFDLVADPDVETGDAIADFAGGSVDASLRHALQRVAEVLRS